MKHWIMAIIQRFNHLLPKKPQHFPHPHNQPTLGAKNKYSPDPEMSTKLNDQDLKRVQSITWYILHCATAFHNKLLVELVTIAT